ncbi:MAG: hypothetical protein ACM359_03770 [Bacillota bacterium]
MMRWAVMLCAMLAGGCTYTETQMRLVEQVQRGVELCKQAQSERSQIIAQYQQAQRERLDSAFDADVRQQAELSADWVVEHRRAYTLALDGLARQRAASVEAEGVATRNLKAMEEALQRLLFLQSLQLKLVKWDESQSTGQSADQSK